MRAVCSIFRAAILFMFFAASSVYASGQPVSGTASTPANPGAMSGTTSKLANPAASSTPAPAPAAGDSKPLPWKFLAKPMGVLDSSSVTELKRVLSCDTNCAVPDGELKKLFGSTIGILPKSQPVYVIMHVVEYPDSATDAATKIISDHWYLFRSQKGRYGDPKWTYEKFTGQRIYGSSSVYFLFLQLNARAVTLAKATQQIKCLIQDAKGEAPEKCGNGDATKKMTSDLSDDAKRMLNDTLKGLSDDNKSLGDQIVSKNSLKNDKTNAVVPLCDASGNQFDWSTQSGISSDFMRVRYEAAVVKRTPANIADLKAIIGLLIPKANANTACVKIAANDVLWGAGRIDNIGLPSDITIAGYAVKDVDSPIAEADRSRVQIGSTGSYNDEQLYWWDASIGIPVHKLKDLQYSDSDNTVTATKVDKQTAYAMFNLMIRPVDLSSASGNLWPRVLVGFPLSNSPWDSLFAGGGIGLPWKPFQNFQFFAGATFLRTKTPSTLAAGQAANNAQLQNDLNIKTTRKLTIGINVPVKSVIDKLK